MTTPTCHYAGESSAGVVPLRLIDTMDVETPPALPNRIRQYTALVHLDHLAHQKSDVVAPEQTKI